MTSAVSLVASSHAVTRATARSVPSGRQADILATIKQMRELGHQRERR